MSGACRGLLYLRIENNSMLKPQDLLVAVVLARDSDLSFEALGRQAGLAPSEAHSAVRRLQASELLSAARRVNVSALCAFAEHGLRYVWPQRFLGPGAGLPTAAAAPGLGHAGIDYEIPPVWVAPAAADVPAERQVRGVIVEPLFRSMPAAALRDDELYVLLALLEGARSKSARERGVSVAELRRRLLAFRQPERPMLAP